MAVAIGARCYGLGQRALSNDEAYSWRIATYSASDLIQRTRDDAHPPLYYLLLKSWVALLGDSELSLRGLSILFAVTSIPLAYLLCLELARQTDLELQPPTLRTKGGGLLAAALVAIHPAQVAPTQTARMYSLGVMLVLLSSWLILRALYSAKRPFVWWALYACIAACFCYTHYYALFSVCAQWLYAAGILYLGARGRQVSADGYGVWGLCLAIGIVFGSYCPWLGTLMAQAGDVYRQFWIPPVTAGSVVQSLSLWGPGIEGQGMIAVCIWIGVVAAYFVLLCHRQSNGRWFVVLQAGIPWILGVIVSVGMRRSIFLDRYLVFAQVFTLIFWGIVWTWIDGRILSALGAAFIGGNCIVGAWSNAGLVRGTIPPIVQAVDVLKERHHAGDMVLVNMPGAVNRFRYYANRRGFDTIDIRCIRVESSEKGHILHQASLDKEDFYLGNADFAEQKRLWKAFDSVPAFSDSTPAGMEVAFERTFWDHENYRCVLILYTRPIE